MENSPLAVWIIVAEACEGERRTVVLAVLVRVYEDIVVFHKICAQGTPSIVAYDLGGEECVD